MSPDCVLVLTVASVVVTGETGVTAAAEWLTARLTVSSQCSLSTNGMQQLCGVEGRAEETGREEEERRAAGWAG